MDNKEHYKLMNQKIDIETVKQQADCQITVGRGGRSGGDNRTCIHAYKYNQWT